MHGDAEDVFIGSLQFRDQIVRSRQQFPLARRQIGFGRVDGADPLGAHRRQFRGGEVALDDLAVRVALLPALHILGRKLPAERIAAKRTGIDLKKVRHSFFLLCVS